jgi:hypothetical protein
MLNGMDTSMRIFQRVLDGYIWYNIHQDVKDGTAPLVILLYSIVIIILIE